MSRPDPIRAAELAAIRAAYAEHRGCAPETCGGSRLDPCTLGNALDALTYACPECNAGGHTCPGDGNPIPHGATDCGEHAEPPAWVLRTWADVRTGDRVRIPGSDNVAYVQHASAREWHVAPGTGTSAYNPPQALTYAVRRVVLKTPGGREVEFDMDPAKPIEIELTPAEVAAIELLGWDNRL